VLDAYGRMPRVPPFVRRLKMIIHATVVDAEKLSDSVAEKIMRQSRRHNVPGLKASGQSKGTSHTAEILFRQD